MNDQHLYRLSHQAHASIDWLSKLGDLYECFQLFWSYFDHFVFLNAKFMRNLPRKAKATPSPQD